MSGIPYTWQEGLIILGLSCSLLILVIALSTFAKIRIGREFVYALVRGGGQLFLIAGFLTIVFTLDQWYVLTGLLIGTMIIVSGYTSAKRAPAMPKAIQITTTAILTGSSIALGVLAVTGAMPLKPQFIIPFSGMAFGNCMARCSIALDRLLREVQLNRVLLETALSLGATSSQALEQIGRLSIRAALIPTIDRLKTLGLIFIPGAMSGLLIAGTNPILAAEYQIIVYLMVVGGGIITALLLLYLTRMQIFTDVEQLQEWVYDLETPS